MQADKGLQFERTDLAQRRTALVMVVLMVASLRFVGTHADGLRLPLALSTVVLAAASALVLRPGLLAEKQAVNFGCAYRIRNLVLCLGTAQAALNVVL